MGDSQKQNFIKKPYYKGPAEAVCPRGIGYNPNNYPAKTALSMTNRMKELKKLKFGQIRY